MPCLILIVGTAKTSLRRARILRTGNSCRRSVGRDTYRVGRLNIID